MPGDNETFDNDEGANTSIQDDNNGTLSDSSTEGNDDNGDIKNDQQEDSSRADAISDALGDSEDDSEEESPASKSQDEDDSDEGDEKKQSEEDSRFDKHPRFQAIIAEKKELEEKLKAYEPIEAVLKDSTMNQDDRLATLQLGESVNRALLGQADPTEVLQSLMPLIEQLQAAAGLVLPDDIKQAVEDGEISEKYAQALAKERAEKAAMQNRTEFEDTKRKQLEQQQKNQEIQQLKSQVLTAVTDWETQQMNSDPDYEQKRELVYSHILADLQKRNAAKQVITAQDAILISNNALSKVTSLMQKALPGKQPIRPNLSSGVPGSKTQGQRPATRAEAIAAALDK